MSNLEIEKTYSPENVEAKWYEAWEKGGHFKPNPEAKKDGYCIIMPPPNVTGQLHMGHALDVTTQDALIRWKRMSGHKTLYLPGMDHAGIATQAVVEKMLQEQGIDRRDLGREKFLEKVWEWKEKYGGVILKQQRAIGASPDWDYSIFTMDPDSNEAVRKVFVDLYNEGLIYQSDYIVNWDPVLQSAISDAEVEFKEVEGAFYHLLYDVVGSDEKLEIATTRPETLLGDTAVCVHPEDERFKHLIGKKAIIPLCDREVPIVADEHVDMELGTGCLKVTPGHDFNDFEIGKRHSLEIINILNKDGTLNSYGLEWEGLSCKKARPSLLEALSEKGILKTTKKHVHQVGHGDRSKAVIEPMVSKQWFLNVEQMASDAVSAVENDETVFWPKQWENTYFSWLRNPRNWCVSRQLWWGHQIPVFYCKDCNHQWADSGAPTECPSCGSKNIYQDPDVLDTWFSSGLWPMTTLGWPNEEKMKQKGFDDFFPGSCLVTGHDIIFFWVARMMMFSLKLTGKKPFDDVYIHAIVRDKLGRKMSKSLGNGIDPLEVTKEFGADALRYTLAAGSGHNRDLNLDPATIEVNRNFINKIWNAFRFISPSLAFSKNELPKSDSLDHHEKWILSSLNQTVEKVNNSMAEYRFDDSCQAITSFVYDKFCSWFIELSKEKINQKDENRASVLKYTFKELVKLLHPFAPFVSEEIWSHIKSDDDTLLISTVFPTHDPSFDFHEDEKRMEKLIELVTNIRNLRSSINLSPKEEILVEVYSGDQNLLEYFQLNNSSLFNLSKVKELKTNSIDKSRPSKSIMKASSDYEVYIPLEGVVNLEEQVSRLNKEIQKSEKELQKLSKKIENPKFINNAKPEVVLKVKQEFSDESQKIEALKNRLKMLK